MDSECRNWRFVFIVCLHGFFFKCICFMGNGCIFHCICLRLVALLFSITVFTIGFCKGLANNSLGSRVELLVAVAVVMKCLWDNEGIFISLGFK